MRFNIFQKEKNEKRKKPKFYAKPRIKPQRLRRPQKTINPVENRSTPSLDFNFVNTYFNSKTGVVVTPKKSLSYSTVFACVDLIASTISIIPLNLYKNSEEGKIEAREHDQFYILRKEPSKLYSRLQWTKLMIVHYLLWGDGVSIIKRNKLGRPVSYNIVMPQDVEIEKVLNELTSEDELFYKINDEIYSSEDVIHFSDLSIDGKKGCGRIDTNKEAVGLGIALGEYGNELFQSGGKTMGYVYGDKPLSKEAYEILTNRFLHGYGEDGNVGILPQGFKYQPFEHPLPPASAEYMASKEFSQEEICTIFRVPPILIAKTKGVNNSVGEKIMEIFLMTTIAPITTMMELEISRKSLRESEKSSHYWKYNIWALEKGNIKSTMDALVQGVNNGLLSKDEARQTLDRNNIPNGLGADFVQPVNVMELETHKDYYKKENNGGQN
jgi:HK97 family phage portal protein